MARTISIGNQSFETLRSRNLFYVDKTAFANKPFYDFTCAFMCQKLSDMKKNQELYFDYFNIDENDEIV